MKDFFSIIVSGLLAGMFAFGSFISVAHGNAVAQSGGPASAPTGTLVSGEFNEDVIWSKSGSPYILTDDMFINGGHTLTIEAGTRVALDPVRLNMTTGVHIDSGTLSILGTPEDRVRIEGIDKIHIFNGFAHVANADFETYGPGLILYWSQADIKDSSFRHSSGAGLALWSSVADIQRSTISDNADTGISVSADADGKPHSSVSVRGSSITGNGRYAIRNSAANDSVSAEGNWWGSVWGPNATGTNAVIGPVAFAPWLESDPTAPPCCSSVLFIPGLEASRLYRPENGALVPGDNRLWEPNRNDDVRKLFLNPDGSSPDQSIYAGQPIGKAFGLAGIYGTFMDFLDGLVRQGTIAEWKPFGYDWRMPVTDVIDVSVRRATTTESLLAEVQALADRSKTGKVSIVAHSNGGLVAKYLVKRLADVGQEQIIDSVISVAVPYLGTPQALLGLLHGDNQSIAGGLILRKSVAKELGTNMPSAYSLLPSAEYFARALGPTIVFASTSDAASSASEQDAFVSSRANASLMKAASFIHGMLDPFTWPARIARWAIVGWGNRTAKTLRYTDTGYRADQTLMGDGTVVVPSAAFNAGTTTALDLPAISRNEGRSYDHSNILESESAQKIVSSLVQKNIPLESVASGISVGEPSGPESGSYITVSTHSPVELHLYDSAGRHTGFAPPPLGFADEDVEEGLFAFVEKNIPGSSFETYGDEDALETYVSVPDDGGTYSAIVQGKGVGEFAYEVERVKDGTVISRIEYSGLPVTPLMVASSSVVSGSAAAQPLFVDVDGNGSAEIIATTTSVLDPIFFFESLKKTVITLLGQTKAANDLVKRIDRIEDAYKKDRKRQAIASLDRLPRLFAHKQFSSITVGDREEIAGMIGDFIAQFE